MRFQCLAQYVASLGQRAFAGVHQEHDAVYHLESALDFAAEVAVAGRVDDVDFHVVIKNRGVFGEDGDATLAFQFVRVHDSFDVVFVGAKGAALLQHGIDQRGFAVVNVRDDSDVANA